MQSEENEYELEMRNLENGFQKQIDVYAELGEKLFAEDLFQRPRRK